MNRTFDIGAQTTPATDWKYVGNQAARAEQCGAVRIFQTGDSALPKYIARACADAGYRCVQIGRTTYVSATWALVSI